MSDALSRISNRLNFITSSDVQTPQTKMDLLKGRINNTSIARGAINHKIKILKSKDAKTEAGSADQMKVKLTSEIGEKIVYGRMKEIKTLNEAIIYHKMHTSNDPLAKFTPGYFGVFDAHGKPIDLDKELKLVAEGKKTREDLYKEHPTAWIVMKDLSNNFPAGLKRDEAREIQDYKFVKDGLVINKDEIKAHGHTVRSKIYTKLRTAFLSQSDCSFAFQKSTKSKWYNWVIVNFKRMLEIKETKQTLNSQFITMEPEELETNIKKLEELKEAFEKSNFTFNDSSLLFVPTLHNGKESIEITLLDLGHGMSIDEPIKNFNEMRVKMSNSVQELIDMMEEVYRVKTSFHKV